MVRLLNWLEEAAPQSFDCAIVISVRYKAHSSRTFIFVLLEEKGNSVLHLHIALHFNLEKTLYPSLLNCLSCHLPRKGKRLKA